MKAVGTLIEKIRAGEQVCTRHHNPYISKVTQLDGILLSPTEIKESSITLLSAAQKPIIVEIGCYLGKNLLEMAHDAPNVTLLGLDITYKRCVKAATKIKAAQLKNAFVGIADVRDLLNSIPDEFIDGFCMFFPDPWPKKRHEKNRLVCSELVAKIFTKLKPGGFFWFKTDHEPYMQNALLICSENWHTSEADVQPNFLPQKSYITAFEKLFMGKELPIYRRVFTKIATKESL